MHASHANNVNNQSPEDCTHSISGKQYTQDGLHWHKNLGIWCKIWEHSRNGRKKNTTLVYKLVAYF